jgi:hypothetical protein
MQGPFFDETPASAVCVVMGLLGVVQQMSSGFGILTLPGRTNETWIPCFLWSGFIFGLLFRCEGLGFHSRIAVRVYSISARVCKKHEAICGSVDKVVVTLSGNASTAAVHIEVDVWILTYHIASSGMIN